MNRVCTGAGNPGKMLEFECSVFKARKVLGFWIKCLKMLEIKCIAFIIICHVTEKFTIKIKCVFLPFA